MSVAREPMSEWDRRWIGFAAVTLLHPVLLLFDGAILFVGLVQLAYAVPILIACSVKGHIYMLQGVLIAVVVAAIVNIGCFGIFLLTFSVPH